MVILVVGLVMFAALTLIAVASGAKIIDGFLFGLGALMCARLFGVI
jgi:hypothetical protein